MDERRYARARAVFFDALDLPAAARRAFVAAECGPDGALRDEVELLLKALEDDEGLDSVGPGRDLRATAEEALRAPSDSSAAGLPRRIGKHDVLGCLGEGGMGVVYEAEQRNPRRRVAIKVLRPSIVTPELVESFRREAELLGRLRHPGIASVFEAGQARPWGRSGPELPYLVMELVDGLPITTYAAKARLTQAQKLELLALTCDAVQHAHDRGVVHRDLKPANVLVDESGQPRVLDFGVARALDAGPGRAGGTGAGIGAEPAHVVGTLSYVSPEQVADTGPRSGPASDVYALGVLLYELLTSRLPLQLVGLPLGEAVRRIREKEPPRLGSLDRRLAGDVEAIAEKALEKDPSRRYASPAHLAADIRRHLAHEPILARRARALDRAHKFALRHRALVASSLAVMAVLAAAGIGGTVLALRADRARRDAETASAEAQRANYRAQLGAAVGALREGDALTARSHLESAPEPLREWTWRHLHASLDDSLGSVRAEVRARPQLGPAPGGFLVLGEDGLSLVAQDGPALRLAQHRAGRFVAASADGTRALEARDDRWLLHDTADLGQRPTDLGGPAGAQAVELPGGEWALEAGGRLAIASADGSSRRSLDAEIAGPIALTPDGALLVVGTTRGIEAWSTRRLDDAPRLLAPERAWVIAFDGAARRMLLGHDDGRVTCVGVDRPSACGWDAIDVGGQRLVSVRVGPAERSFLAVDRPGRVTTWSLDDGSPAGLVSSTGHGSARAFWAPGGDAVVLPRTNGSLVTLTPEGRAASLPRVGHESGVESVGWFGGWMLSVDRLGVVRTFASPSAGDRRRLSGHEAYAYAAQFTPDGKAIVSTGWDGTVRSWEATTGRPLATARPGGTVGRTLRVVGPDRAVAVVDGALVLVDVATGEVLARREGTAVDLDVAADRLVVLHLEGEMESWDLALERRLAHWPSIGGSPPDARRIALGADGRRVAVSAGSVVKELDLETGSELWTAASVQGDVLGLSRRPGSDLIAGACRDGAVTLWDARTGQTVREMRVPGSGTLAVAFHPSEPLLITGSHDGSVQSWDVETGERIARLPAHDDYVKSLAFSPDGSMLVTASGDTTLQLLDAVPLAERLARHHR